MVLFYFQLLDIQYQLVQRQTIVFCRRSYIVLPDCDVELIHMNREEIIIPAIIAKTQNELEEKILKVKDFVELIQLDLMDGRFVPNNSIDFNFKLPETNCHFEAHIMIECHEKWNEKVSGEHINDRETDDHDDDD